MYNNWVFISVQILDAIDEPNHQRLERPECCPMEMYRLMLKCWEHEPNDRPTFSEVMRNLAQVIVRPSTVDSLNDGFFTLDFSAVGRSGKKPSLNCSCNMLI